MSTTPELPTQYLGNVVPYSFNAGFICLSYVISLIGAMSTLELVSRRTSQKGLYNQVLVLGAAISMGGISIWSMHYIGNRAIYIHHGEYELQIVYSIRNTIVSLFLPIIVLLIAFLAVSSNDRVQWWRIGLSGFLAGAAICGMHYLGNQSIENYQCEYSIGTIVGAALIAVIASTAALALFFVLQAAWTISWWRKILCAMLLAGAVSGMHWCAAVGTKYRLLHFYTGEGEMSRETTIVVVICLSIAASLILVGSAAYSARTRMRYATKAQQIALAAAVFDARGRILVNQEGLLPSEVITDTILQKSNDDVFGIHHPLFHWMFRASRNWPSVATFLDAMTSHIAQHPSVRRDNKTHNVVTGQGSGQLADNYDLILREHFCLAASALASKTNENLPGAGVLWDEIFPTGAPARPAPDAGSRMNKRLRRVDQDQAEKGMRGRQEYSRGSLMFLVRHVDDSRDARELERAGYRFVDRNQVVGIITASMQIQSPNFNEELGNMAAYRENKTKLAPGVHVGMFAIRARLDYGGFDVLVDKDRRNILPTIQLPLDRLEQWQMDLLNRFDGLKMSVVAKRLLSMVDCSEEERQFRSELRNVVVKLGTWLKDPVFEDAVLISKIIQVPCSSSGGNSRSLASVITFKLVLDIHDNAHRSEFEFTPLQLFKVQQLVYEGSPHRLAFSHDVHRELSSILGSIVRPPPTASTVRHGRFSAALRTFGRARGNGSQAGTIGSRKDMFTTSQERLSATTENTQGRSFSNGDLSSLDGDPKSPSFDRDVPLETMTNMGKQKYGGIMVSQQITVNVHETSNSEYLENINSNNSDTNQSPSGQVDDGTGRSVHLYSGPGSQGLNVEADKSLEKSTFVDELMALCMNPNARA